MEKLIGQLKDAGFIVTEAGNGTFDVTSERTGSRMKSGVDASELNRMLVGIEYIKTLSNKGDQYKSRPVRERHTDFIAHTADYEPSFYNKDV